MMISPSLKPAFPAGANFNDIGDRYRAIDEVKIQGLCKNNQKSRRYACLA
jgi:hypothetical protein